MRLRWKLCKIWGCTVDDPRFYEITPSQWAWYAQMVSNDEKEQFDRELAFVEYGASFWNSEGVQQVRRAREQRDMHAFPDDAEFERRIKEEEFKNNPLIKAIQKLKQEAANLDGKVEGPEVFKSKKIKPPLDLKNLLDKTEI